MSGWVGGPKLAVVVGVASFGIAASIAYDAYKDKLRDAKEDYDTSISRCKEDSKGAWKRVETKRRQNEAARARSYEEWRSTLDRNPLLQRRQISDVLSIFGLQ